MSWETVLYSSHWIFAALLLAMSFVHRGYALAQACRGSALFYLVGLYLADIPHPPHWAVFAGLDLLLAFWIIRLRAPIGAAWALVASAFLCSMNGIGAYGTLFYDRYEPLTLTLNLAQVYYLVVLPRIQPRDRRAIDRLASH